MDILSSIGISPVSLLGQLVSFGILYVVFKKFLFGPILENLDKRAKKQAKALKAAEDTIRIKDELTANEKKVKQNLQKQVQQEFARAQKEADVKKEEMIAQAREEAKLAAQKEYEVFAKKIQVKEEEVKKDLSQLVIRAAKKTLLEHLDQSTGRQIVDRQIKKLSRIKV